ncbi:MAG: hypothetical protein BWY61_00800 [Firmicutes bacterium ADurb.Bin354]|nr:MAG: hypothetical protein BWY61_00800 [Firmicutes bacterium ADurb.Bin354]
MSSVCHSRKSRKAFTLASRSDDDLFLIRIIPEFIKIHKGIFRGAESFEIKRCLDYADHAASLYGNLSAILMGYVYYLLNSVNVGCKSSNDEPFMLLLLKDIPESIPNGSLRGRKARTLRISAVTHKGQHSFFAKLTESLQIYCITEYGSIVYFEVTRMNDDTLRCVNCQRSSINDAVIGTYKFYV